MLRLHYAYAYKLFFKLTHMEGGYEMTGASIYHWSWFKRPDARIENGLIIEGEGLEPYQPGESIISLLNAVQQIIDEPTALEFVKQWGALGLLTAPAAADARWNIIKGAVEYTCATRANPDIEEIRREVLNYYNPEGGYNNTSKGDPVSGVIKFAQRIRALSEVKRLLKLYEEDAYAARYEAEEELTPTLIRLLLNVDIEELKEEYRLWNTGTVDAQVFYLYVLDVLINAARKRLSSSSQRGIWIQLRNLPITITGHSTGVPGIRFDSLFRFIEYVLLVEGYPSPKRCADPKCGQLFFPAKSDQRYCPPPPGVKRSRCENRHTQTLRREGKKDKGGR